jgi:glycosyltransferase involved in cell wall biosynthesis
MNTPRVSVIITNYNRVDLLKEAIQSIIDQTYQDFEIVVVDDGSQDHSLEVIEAFQQRLPDKINLYTHEGQSNKGIVPTYQLGISKARGDYIAFLEHDDRWSPDYLAPKVEILQTHSDVGVVFSPYQVVGSGWFGRDMMLRQWLLRFTIKTSRSFDNFANLLQCNNVATFSCFVTRKSLLDSIPFPSEKILAYDWWILIHLSIHNQFYCDMTSTTYWRWSKQSAIGKQTFECHRNQGCDFMEQMYYQIDKNADSLPASKQKAFQIYQENFAYFLSYYKQPGFLKFITFFRRSPSWALASMVSLIINHLKFKRNRK